MVNRPLNTGDQPVLVPEVIANESLGLLGSYLNLGKTVLLDSDIAPVGEGEKIKIPRRGTIVAKQKVVGQPTEKQTPSTDYIEVNIDQHWYVKIGEEDASLAVQKGSALPGYLTDSVIVLAEKIENSLASWIPGFGDTNIDCGPSDSPLQKVIDVNTAMAMNKVPQLMRKFGYIHPTFAGRLMKENAFIDPKLIPNNQALMDGMIGRVQGFDTFSGQLVPSAGSPAWYQNFFYTRNALVLASRPLRDVESKYGVDATVVQSEAGLALRVLNFFDPNDLAMVFHIDVLFGSGINDERHGYVLESRN